MVAKLQTKDGLVKRYYHYIDTVDCVIKHGFLFFYLKEKDGEEHFLPCDKYSLIGLESEE